MARKTRTRQVGKAQIRAYLAKAEEFEAAATAEPEAGRPIATTSLAIHAAINAADAVCGACLGKRAAGQDHDRVCALLRDAGRDGTDPEKDLQRLLPLKTEVEYEPDSAAHSAAAKAVERSRRCVKIARRVAASRA